jgi:hypothetical protein
MRHGNVVRNAVLCKNSAVYIGNYSAAGAGPDVNAKKKFHTILLSVSG